MFEQVFSSLRIVDEFAQSVFLRLLDQGDAGVGAGYAFGACVAVDSNRKDLDGEIGIDRLLGTWRAACAASTTGDFHFEHGKTLRLTLAEHAAIFGDKD